MKRPREALALLQDLRLPRVPRGAPLETVEDLEFTELPKHTVLQVEEAEA